MSLAYERAKKYRIISEDTQEDAKLYTPLTRGELAKIITHFARNILNKPYVADPLCSATSFSDSEFRDDELTVFIEEACSLGLM